MNQHAAVVGLLDEVGEHLLGDLEIGDDAVFHGLDGHHVAGGAAEHVFGFAADGHDFAAGLVDGHDGGLVDDDALALGEDESVGGAQVNGQVGREQAENRAEAVSVFVNHRFRFWGAARAAPNSPPRAITPPLGNYDGEALDRRAAPPILAGYNEIMTAA